MPAVLNDKLKRLLVIRVHPVRHFHDSRNLSLSKTGGNESGDALQKGLEATQIKVHGRFLQFRHERFYLSRRWRSSQTWETGSRSPAFSDSGELPFMEF